MTRHTLRPVLPLVTLMAAASAAAADTTIKDYLFTHNAGPVAANDIIGVAKTVVSDLQTPKDFAASVGNYGDRDTQNGFGLSFTPGRSAFKALSVSADRYGKGELMDRIWGGTTLSYAQNRKKIGTADYDQSAFAVSTTFLLNHEDDPIVVAYKALTVSEGADVKCKVQQADVDKATTDSMAEQRRLVAEFQNDHDGKSPDKKELQAIVKQAKAQLDAEMKALTQLRACASKVAADVEKKWNASRFQLLVGRGWIKPAAGGGERLRLATHYKLSLAWGPTEDSLFNLTWRRAGDELDLTTLGGTPAYKNTNSAGIRYTYKPLKDGKTFALAEVSNVKATTSTTSQADFKQALGVDQMLMPGIWLELRYGRARTVNGTGLENKALMTLKFSQDTSLGKDIN